MERGEQLALTASMLPMLYVYGLIIVCDITW